MRHVFQYVRTLQIEKRPGYERAISHLHVLDFRNQLGHCTTLQAISFYT